MTRVWDLPFRLWHWALALSVLFSLYTGLSGDISLMEWHQRSGFVVLGLLVFRVGWWIWGGRYVRLSQYWTTPRRFIRHFAGSGIADPHTSPGIVLAVVLIAALAVQAVYAMMRDPTPLAIFTGRKDVDLPPTQQYLLRGLFTAAAAAILVYRHCSQPDDIFNEGPLTRYVEAEVSSTMTWIHHRDRGHLLDHHRFIGASPARLVASTHITANAVYAMMRDPTPLAIFTGRKDVDLPPTQQYLLRGLSRPPRHCRRRRNPPRTPGATAPWTRTPPSPPHAAPDGLGAPSSLQLSSGARGCPKLAKTTAPVAPLRRDGWTLPRPLKERDVPVTRQEVPAIPRLPDAYFHAATTGYFLR